MTLLLLVLAAATAPADDPLARARQGEAQCHYPDLLFKTCLSLDYFVPVGPGEYVDRGTNVVALDQPFVMETSIPVQVRGKKVCATMRATHFLSGKVSVEGNPVPNQQSAKILAEFNRKMAPVRDKEVCMEYEPTADGFHVAKLSVAGVRRPDLDQHFIWVKPSDGYKVAP